MSKEIETLALKKDTAELIKEASKNAGILQDELIDKLIESLTTEEEKKDTVKEIVDSLKEVPRDYLQGSDSISELVRYKIIRKLLNSLDEDEGGSMNLDKVLSMLLVNNLIERIGRGNGVDEKLLSMLFEKINKGDKEMDKETLLLMMMLMQQQQQMMMMLLSNNKKDDESLKQILQAMNNNQQTLMTLLLKSNENKGNDDLMKMLILMLMNKDQEKEKLLNLERQLFMKGLQDGMEKIAQKSGEEISDLKHKLENLNTLVQTIISNPAYMGKLSDNEVSTIKKLSKVLKETAEGLRDTQEAIEEMSEILGVKKDKIVNEQGKIDIGAIIDKVVRLVEKAITARASAPKRVEELPEIPETFKPTTPTGGEGSPLEENQYTNSFDTQTQTVQETPSIEQIHTNVTEESVPEQQESFTESTSNQQEEYRYSPENISFHMEIPENKSSSEGLSVESEEIPIKVDVNELQSSGSIEDIEKSVFNGSAGEGGETE